MLEPSGDGTRRRRVRRGAVTPTRLRRRVAVAFVLAVGVATGVLAVGSYVVVRNARLDASANQSVHQTVVNLRYAINQPNVQALLRPAGAGPVLTGCGVDSGCDTADVRRHRRRKIPAGLRRLVGGGRLARQRVVVGGTHYLVVGGALPETQKQYYFFYNEQQVWSDLAVLRNVLAVGWLALVVLAGLGGTLFARRTLAPVAQASNAARSLAEGLLDTRLPVASDDEFGAWAAAFNDMAARWRPRSGPWPRRRRASGDSPPTSPMTCDHR